MLRTALVGLGRIGVGFHGPAIRAHFGYELTGIVDPLAERRVEMSTQWSVPAYETLEELVSRTPVDLVVIASPTLFHAEQTRTAFAHGAHVLCDKPVATSLAELDAILDHARAADRRFLAYQPARFAPEVLALRSILERNVLGPLHYIRRSRCAYSRRNDWQTFRALGGGMLNNWGSHCLDEIVSLLPGESFERVSCTTRTIASTGDAEDVVNARLLTASGIAVDVDVSQACTLGGAPWEVRGQFGSAVYNADTKSWRLRFFDPEKAGPPPPPQTGLAAHGRSYANEELPWQDLTIHISDFDEPDFYEPAYRYFSGETEPPIAWEDSRRVIELIERCRHDADASNVMNRTR